MLCKSFDWFLYEGNTGTEWVKYYDNAKEIARKTFGSSDASTRENLLKRRLRPKLDAKNQLFMWLSWLCG